MGGGDIMDELNQAYATPQIDDLDEMSLATAWTTVE